MFMSLLSTCMGLLTRSLVFLNSIITRVEIGKKTSGEIEIMIDLFILRNKGGILNRYNTL